MTEFFFVDVLLKFCFSKFLTQTERNLSHVTGIFLLSETLCLKLGMCLKDQELWSCNYNFFLFGSKYWNTVRVTPIEIISLEVTFCFEIPHQALSLLNSNMLKIIMPLNGRPINIVWVEKVCQKITSLNCKRRQTSNKYIAATNIQKPHIKKLRKYILTDQ